MKEVTRVIDTRTVNGKLTNIVRNFFIYESEGNVMSNAHKYFSKDEKKQAKLNYKLSNIN